MFDYKMMLVNALIPLDQHNILYLKMKKQQMLLHLKKVNKYVNALNTPYPNKTYRSNGYSPDVKLHDPLLDVVITLSVCSNTHWYDIYKLTIK